ncbi:flagellar hook-basal body complex protein [Azospirillum sp.]|uniref:flagellar hook-basal body complex protein n=1 Tax=Azospirillum sp. TaxID=34012 RepID=UPI003D752CAB
MSVFGSMTTAVAGLAAQAQALGNLSDNISNSQTIGYKRVETTFQELVTTSNADKHSPGGVRAKPSFTNSTPGNISQTQTATNMAISGNGFFQVSQGVEGSSGISFQDAQYFTRAGDFTLDRFGYMKNSAGMYLNGWGVDSKGAVDKGSISPIRIQQLIDTPSATQNINLSANLPLAPTTANQPAQSVSLIDAAGEEHTLQLNWRQQSQGNWRLSIVDPSGDTADVTSGQLLSSIADPLAPTTALLGTIGDSGGLPVPMASAVDPVQHSTTLTLDTTTVTANKAYTVSVGGRNFSYTATATDVTTPDNVAYQLWSQIQAAGVCPGGASVAANVLTLNGDTNGNSLTVSATPSADLPLGTNTPVVGVKQVVSIPLGGTVGNVNDVYTVDFSGVGSGPVITYQTDGTESSVKELAERIAAAVNANTTSPATASVVNGTVVLTAKTATTLTDLTNLTLSATPGYKPAYVDVGFSGGYLSSLGSSNVGTGSITIPPSQTTGENAYIEFNVDYGYGAQKVKLNLGQFGSATSGLTQFTGTSITENSKTQDGFTRGAFQNLEVKASGDVVANYDNGRSRVLARVPVIQVTNPDGMQKVNGNAYQMTRDAGGARADDAGANGAGGFAVSSIEGSNVDIAQEFTKLIVTQRAYSANTKVVTASDEMLQETLGMKR